MRKRSRRSGVGLREDEVAKTRDRGRTGQSAEPEEVCSNPAGEERLGRKRECVGRVVEVGEGPVGWTVERVVSKQFG